MIWKRKQPRKLTGVGATLTASHRDPRNGDVHEHTWEIIAWFDYRSDARDRQYMLEKVLGPYQGKCLPDRIAWGEPLAEQIARDLNGFGYEHQEVVKSVDVSRPTERIYGKWSEE